MWSSVGTQPLYDNTLPPPQIGRGQELGIKTSFFDGRISSDFAWFRDALTNNYAYASGLNPAGNQYVVPIGDVVQEGVDGDLTFSVVSGWQVIGSFYAGHARDSSAKPINGSYDNSWSMMNRYVFPSTSALHDFAVGAGVLRFGGRYMSTANYTDAPFSAFTLWSGEIKMETGTAVNMFAIYKYNKHLTIKLNCNNVLNQDYPDGGVEANYISVAYPRTFTLELDYKL